ncbi:MAG: zinc ribbon domain-containing protein [Candidatus Omnitrophica bacterium]|nr:zinc ribbon domain-containing protein [Candidatus Omnitrophota bacterium]
MPTYEYECQACGHVFEELQAMTAPKLTLCPQCHKKKLTRLIGRGSGMIFKGSGFYETDYKKKSLSAAEKKEASKPASTSSPQGSPCNGCPCKGK